VTELLALAEGVEARVTKDSRWLPLSYKNPEEARLEEFGPEWLPGHPIWEELQHWWLVHAKNANTPNWDIALGCEIEGRPGLILVEAKAHEAELDPKPKERSKPESDKSRENHDQIGRAIEQARDALRVFDSNVNVSRDTHYQLSNRVAFLWRLAQAGIPTVVIYLGFTGDQQFGKGVTPFRDHEHWVQKFREYADQVWPQTMIERRLEIAPVPVWFLVRSRDVIEPSPWG
jgi:hypothetical protein